MIINKILTTIAVLSVLVASVIIASTPTATGYELSLYYAYPVYFWVVMGISIFCGIFILIRQAFTYKTDHYWLAGFMIMIASNAIILALPFFRGYGFFPAGDAMTHVGMMKDIIASGHVGYYNIYPPVHLLGVNLIYITGLDEATVTNLLFISWNMAYLLGIFLLARILANRFGQTMLIIAISCPLVFSTMHVVIHPSMLSLFMVPYLLYSYHRSKQNSSGQTEFALIVIILALFITYTHPVTCLFVIALLVVLNFSITIYTWIVNSPGKLPGKALSIRPNYYVPLLIFVLFYTWYLSHGAIQGSIRNVYDFFAHGSGATLFETQVNTLAMAGISTSQTVLLFVYRYGPIFIYAFAGAISALLLIWTAVKRKAPFAQVSFSYAVLFVLAVAVSGFSLFGFTGEFSPVRVSRFFLMLAPFVIALATYEFAFRGKQQLTSNGLNLAGKVVVGLTSVLILSAAILGMLNIYGSPRVVNSNWQVTRMNLAGTGWFSSHQDGYTAIATTGITLGRYDSYNFGEETRLWRSIIDPIPIPSNFGYDNNKTMADTYNNKARYLMTCESDRMVALIFPDNIRPIIHNYVGQGFSDLAKDPTVGLIYANPELEVWRTIGGQLK